ncbi:alkaline phosphatase family protein [Adhaeribacter sp. BT258]|uniref:Alkaline phosphatase family protein n=1 Tax=Adhaeribacter terrigena TaxID=2793070 RepID=A0ABS1C637_9BACT|nr:alkaline phosphatase family protein [Adhaeribacter terrigena]MBK0404783.1 alkaline phosphatase family protein [Adhaeribacter terrigena]
MTRFLFFLLFQLQTLAFSGCRQPAIQASATSLYKTRNVVVVVVDGPRYSETWGSKDHALVPRMANELAHEGVINPAFYNTGPTYTNAGHAAITTGVHQHINNSGLELPRNPSYLQYWLEATGNHNRKAWIVTSKDKLHILANTKDKTYQGKFLPATNCGINGPNTGYRQDSVTLRVAKNVLQTEKPNLLFINFKEPDSRGHSNDWEGYLRAIKACDEYVFQLWKFLQEDEYYRGTTTFIVTNDHGRHLDGHDDGFVSHGDNCEGCRHLNFYASGPDFKTNVIIGKKYNQTDIPATIAELLHFRMPTGKGDVMWELFSSKP